MTNVSVMTNAESEVRNTLESWAAAVERRDLDAVVAAHAADVVFFDVPPPTQRVGVDAYRDSWPAFFDYLNGGEFRWQELHVVAGDDVAVGFGIIGCRSAEAELFPVRVTIGLRREANGWLVVNEHHSVPSE